MSSHNYHYNIPYESANTESLFTLCTRIVALNITSNLVVAQSLPASVKSVLATLLGRRNLLTGPVLRSLAHPDLKTLNLAGSKVRDSTVKILQCLTKLVLLHIPGNKVSVPGLIQLFPYLPHLGELDISNCKVDDQTLVALTDSCAELQVIILGKCPHFTDRGFRYLATKLHNITVLDISYTKVTDGGLKALSNGPSCRKLKELHIDGCQELTSQCGPYLQAFPCLTMLSFYDCPGLLKSEWFESFSCDKKKLFKNISFTI